MKTGDLQSQESQLHHAEIKPLLESMGFTDGSTVMKPSMRSPTDEWIVNSFWGLDRVGSVAKKRKASHRSGKPGEGNCQFRCGGVGNYSFLNIDLG